MIRLKSLLEADTPPVSTQQATSAKPAQAQPAMQTSGQDTSASEYSPSFDFNDFKTKLAQTTETAKNNFQEKLLKMVGNKKVMARASKGQPGQPLKDYTINVSGVSIDYYYDKYEVILKDEKDKEYFLDTMMKIRILGPAESTKTMDSKTPKSPKSVAAKPPVAPIEKTPNTATQGI